MSTPLPDKNVLRTIFNKVDKDHSGSINGVELQSALSNGTWTPFNPETIRMMIGIFDRDRSSTIDFEEFVSLWKYVNDWQNCFRSFDKDNSGSIDRNELKQALVSFGYRLSDSFYEILLKTLATRKNILRSGGDGALRTHRADDVNAVLFDDFIYICCKIQTLTNAFRQYDYQQNGTITLKYEDFLTLVFGLSN